MYILILIYNYIHIACLYCVYGQILFFWQVIKNLKECGVIKEVSISPSSALNKDFYFPLYNTCPFLIDWVDYQFQNEVTSVFAPNILLDRYNKLVTGGYPRKKVFAGYSAENEDWATLSPIVFFLGGMDILKKKRGVGISIHYHNYYKEIPHNEWLMSHDTFHARGMYMLSCDDCWS